MGGWQAGGNSGAEGFHTPVPAAPVPAEARAVRSVAKLHIEDIPALAAGGLNDWRCGMLIGNSREAISVNLPVTRRGAVGRQKLRLCLRSIVPIDDVVLSVADRRSEYVQSCCGDR